MTPGRPALRPALGLAGCVALWLLLASPSLVVPPPRPEVDVVAQPPGSSSVTTAPTGLNLIELRAGMVAYAGRPVRVEGFARTGGRIPAGRLLLYRFRLRCCGAETIEPVPIAVFVEAPPGVPPPPEEAWLEVEGVPEWEMQAGLRVPVVRASSLRVVPRPDDPHLH